ncbi:hypothetical protein LguiA_009402 [Lonicera macranthoides]
MESWSYISGGKGFITDESVSDPKDGSMGWELKTPCSFGTNSHEAIENQEFVELGFPDLMRKSLSNGSIRDVLGSKIDGGSIFHPVTSSHNVFSSENESSSKLSSSVVESNCRDSAFIDLKLGMFADLGETHYFESLNTNPNFKSSMSAKRVRVGSLSSSIPFCQVQGCKKDLSSSKDYHKRHKVCEIHSKTAKVIVNGIEQRFCQQCSRFHLLPEFDDGKRSCRKRLAGHNERRRKPHVDVHYGRTGRSFQSYKGSAGTRFQGNAVTTSSFICQDILPSRLVHLQKYNINNWCNHIKVEDMTEYNSQSAINTIANEQIHPRSFFPSYGFEKHCPPAETGNKFNENNNQYKHDPPSSSLGPHSALQNTSLGGEGFTFFDSASTVQALSGVSDSGRALSLLSSPSQNSSCQSSIPMGLPLIIPGNQVSDQKLFEVDQQGPTTLFSHKFHSNSLQGSNLDPMPVSDGSDAVNFGFDLMIQGSEFTNTKEDRISCEGGSTIDLLQLSSQLQEVEHQRQTLLVKQENYSFRGLRIT